MPPKKDGHTCCKCNTCLEEEDMSFKAPGPKQRFCEACVPEELLNEALREAGAPSTGIRYEDIRTLRLHHLSKMLHEAADSQTQQEP